MCGRFVSSTPVSALAELFLIDQVEVEAHEPSWNVAPTDQVLAVLAGPAGRVLRPLRWGLVPSWAKDRSVGNRMVNLRAETVSEKPAFRRTLARRRCILPADGFYEWKDMGKGRKSQPFFVRMASGDTVALAGMWERWQVRGEGSDGAEDELRTCTIITTTPNALMAPLHDRMPVVLPPASWDAWLDPANDDVDRLRALLVPAAEGLLELLPVSSAVSNVRNEGPHLITPLEGHEGDLLDTDSSAAAQVAGAQQSLFS